MALPQLLLEHVAGPIIACFAHTKGRSATCTYRSPVAAYRVHYTIVYVSHRAVRVLTGRVQLPIVIFADTAAGRSRTRQLLIDL